MGIPGSRPKRRFSYAGPMTSPRKRPPGRLGKGLSSLMAAPVKVTPPDGNASAPERVQESPVAATDSAAQAPRSVASAEVEATASDVPRGTPASRVEEVPLEDLHPNPLQPRRGFDEAALDGLAASIRAEGIIQPITARPRPAGGFEIVAGERRWRAAQRAGLPTVPTLLRPLTDADTARWALIENLQREDLNPIERAEALQGLCDSQGLKHAEVGEAVGLSRSSVTNLLRLLTLAPAVRGLLIDGHLRMGHARALAALDDTRAQEALGRRAAAEGWSVRMLEQAVRKASPGDAAKRGPQQRGGTEVRAAWLRDLESQLTAGLETPVRVAPGRAKGTGTVTLEYRSLEDFDRLLERLGIRTG